MASLCGDRTRPSIPYRARSRRSQAAAKPSVGTARPIRTVEKFVGDAVLAVFAIPEVREDDALRAVRARGRAA